MGFSHGRVGILLSDLLTTQVEPDVMPVHNDKSLSLAASLQTILETCLLEIYIVEVLSIMHLQMNCLAYL